MKFASTRITRHMFADMQVLHDWIEIEYSGISSLNNIDCSLTRISRIFSKFVKKLSDALSDLVVL